MANVTANFSADFSSFEDAVKGAIIDLESFKMKAVKVAPEVARVSDALSGRKMTEQAKIMAEAVGRIGGVSKLTQDELFKLGDQAERAIAKMRAIGMEVPENLQAVANAAADARKKLEQVPASKVNTFFGDLKGQVLSTAAGFLTAQAAIGAVSGGFRALSSLVSDSVTAFGEAEAAQKRLATALRNQGTSEAIGQYNDLATQFQQTTKFGDDLINEMQALLVQVGDVMPSQMEGALTAATNLSAGLGIDLRTATEMVAKAAAGHTESLSKQGITIDKAAYAAKGFSAVLDEVNKRFGGQAAAELDTYSGRVEKLAQDWNNVQEAIGNAIVNDPLVRLALREIGKAAQEAGDNAETFGSKVKTAGQSFAVAFVPGTAGLVTTVTLLETAADRANTLAQALSMAGGVKSPFAAMTDGRVAGAISAQLSETERLSAAMQDVSLKAEPLTAAQQQVALAALNAGKSVSDTTQILQRYWPELGKSSSAVDALSNGLKRSAEETKKATEAQQKWLETIDKATEKLNLSVFTLGRFGAVTMPAATQGIADQHEALMAWRLEIEGVTTDVYNWGAAHEKTTGILERQMGMLSLMPSRVRTAGEAFREAMKDGKTFSDFMSTDLPKVIMGAFQGGGDVGKSIGSSIGGFLTGSEGAIGKSIAKIGGSLGRMLNSIVPGLGAIIGGIGGQLVGKLFGTLTKSEGKQVNDLRDAFQATFGSFETMAQKAAVAGYDIKRLLDAKNVKDYKAEVDKLNAALKFQDDAMAKLDETVQRYGFSIEELGPAFARQQLDKQAQGLWQDFQVLTSAGIDIDTVLGKMGGSINEFVANALRTGTEVPAAMAPMLQRMVEMGTLTDANGNQITDLEKSGVSFSMTMSQGFQSMIGAVDKLTKAISRGLGLALDETSNVLEDLSRGVTIPIDFRLGSPGDLIDPYVPAAARGGRVLTDGIKYFGRGGFVPKGTDTVPAMLTPGEIVLNQNQQKAVSALMDAGVQRPSAFMAGSRGDIHVEVVSVLDGREVARSVTTRQSRDLRNRRKVAAA